jgi:acyl-homoserine-lactone acylase
MKHSFLRRTIICIWLLLSGAVSSATAQINPANVTIARDKWGVPHIFAATDPEVAYGLAWAHAEDDFKTIQLTLLGGKGMLGRHLGKSGAAIDYVVGLIRAQEQAKRDYPAKFSADYCRLLDGYVQGINDYAQAHPNEVLVRRAFPVMPTDVIAGFILSSASFSGIDTALRGILGGTVPAAPVLPTGGSNALAINSKRTADGQTYIAINSHQPLEGPVAWYEAHLCSEQGWNILGGLFPGAATILHGCNENLAWAHTVNYHDKMDVYQLEINPENTQQYKVDGKWQQLETRKVKLRVKGIPIAIAKKAYWSDFGPTVVTKKGTYALRWSGLFESRTGEQWYRMNKAQSFHEFYRAIQMTAIPGGFNIIYADRHDTIFYVTNGKLPRRDPAFNWRGTLPGNTARTIWTQFHPIEAMPQVVNPASGYVFNTNNTPYHCTAPAESPKPGNYDPTMGIETFELNRSKRMTELMDESPSLVSYADFKRIKYDLQLPRTLSYRLDANLLLNLAPAADTSVAPLAIRLKNWNRRADTSNRDASVFLVAYRFLVGQRQQSGLLTPLTADECVAALRHAKTYLTTHFGSTDISLGTLQHHTRGAVSLPIAGIPDVLAAMDDVPAENGRLRAHQGESYIELVRFSKDKLPQIETINAYGASNHADSPHYTDQMQRFVNQQTKPMTLDKTEVLRDAVRTYHPGQ